MSAAIMQIAEQVHDTSAPQGLEQLVSGPWALKTEPLLQLCIRYDQHRRGPKIDFADFKKSEAFKQTTPGSGYRVFLGVAVIPMVGLLAPKASLFARIYGATSLQVLGEQVKTAAADARVKAIVLSVNSPGGSVWGTPELADTVYSLATKKPIVAHTSGCMNGAAYWIGCAANAVVIGGPTTEVGGIGVLVRPPAHLNAAHQPNEFLTGRYTHEMQRKTYREKHAQAYPQHRADYLYSVFVEAVAKARGVGTDHARSHLAKGRVFTGSEAIEAGLADECMGLNALITDLAKQPSAYAQRRRVSARAGARAHGFPHSKH